VGEPGEGVRFAACYCVESKQLLQTKEGKPYLRLQLCDKSGSIEGRIWEGAERVDSWVVPGGYVGVRGRIQSFRSQRQLKIEEIEAVEIAADEFELFLPTTPYDLGGLEAGLDALIATIADEPLRHLLELVLGAESESGRAFRRAPAAKRNHHAYVGGLLEHTLSIARVADLLARHYGAALDRDLLIAGALLHDLGKIEEIGVAGGFPYTDPGKLLGHILLGIAIVRDAARDVPELSAERLLLLLHLIASHQGKYEWQSPRIPLTLEAIVLHFADDLDAKMQHAMALVGSVEEGWTPYDPGLGRDLFRHRNRDVLAAAELAPLPAEFVLPPIDARPAAAVAPAKASAPKPRRKAKGEGAPRPRAEAPAPAPPPEPEGPSDQVSIFDLL
jgi:3'-5' exoribonuclease